MMTSKFNGSKNEDYFSTYHPIINFIYFVFVIGVSMFLIHPVFLGIGLCSAMAYSVLLNGCKKVLKEGLIFMMPLFMVVALMNPLFNHYGVTVLFYLYNGNPVTLESVVYGLAMAVMLCEVIIWFQCYNKIMTSDKFIYLFGRVIPGFSLILSMCLRFVPRFKNRMKVIRDGQKCIGRDAHNGNVIKRIRQGITILSILITWSLENAIDMADSMKSRGYGLRGRTAFSIYQWDGRDKRMLGTMAILVVVFIVGCGGGFTSARYNPRIEIQGVPLTPMSMITFLSYGIFCFLPVMMDMADDKKWKVRRKNIEHTKQKGYRLWM